MQPEQREEEIEGVERCSVLTVPWQALPFPLISGCSFHTHDGLKGLEHKELTVRVTRAVDLNDCKRGKSQRICTP